MTSPPLPSAEAFRRRTLALSLLAALPGLATVVSSVLAMLDVGGSGWIGLFALAAAIGVLAVGPLLGMRARTLVPVFRYLERGSALSPGEQRLAFATVIDLPRRMAQLGAAGWIVAAVAVSLAAWLLWPPFGAFEAAALSAGGLGAGLVAPSFLFFLVKRSAEPVRAALASQIPDSEQRRELIRTTPFGHKLLVCVGGVVAVPMLFAALFSQGRMERAVADVALRWQHQVLDGLSRPADPEGLVLDVEAVLAGERARYAPLHIRVLGSSEGGLEKIEQLLDPDAAARLRGEIRSGAERGDSSALASRHVFAWRRLDADRLLLSILPAHELDRNATGALAVYGVLLAVVMGVALGLATLLADDVSRATEVLRSEAERMASGDLRAGKVWESEDELGVLARSFEGMGRSLRETVARVAEAADRVEATAGEVASVSEAVASVTVDQVRGIQQTVSSMEEISAQVRGIAESSQALNVSVEEASSSILELGAAGEELNETARTLSGRVGEVSSSIEQMVRSVKRVSENTEALSEVAVETSASMDEMAASMREVDASAEETAQLSDQVVGSAESGQLKVRQTIEGMEAIREATETAEVVIRSLGSRAKEIGAIVDVIDDVADETGLLALNAAIIAAQAGEHGRAFSVVADEIKDLAERVMVSTKEIGGLIRAVQEEASNAMGAIEQGTRSVASGVDLSAEAGVSLEEITRASRESGTRIAGIVAAVREQAKAASHVVELMEQVRNGVEEIGAAATEQERGNEVVYRSSVAMREVAQQVRATTEEQARGSGRIAESVEEVREAVEQINSALQEQSATCRSAMEFLGSLSQRTRSNEESARRMGGAARDLLRQAEGLREDVQKFRV